VIGKYMYTVTDLTVLQIWTLLLNGRVRISSLPTQRFSDYTGQRNINPLPRNVYKQNAYFRGNEYCQLLSFLSNQIVGTEDTTVRGVLYPGREICLWG
jgi:hypothetical protein